MTEPTSSPTPEAAPAPAAPVVAPAPAAAAPEAPAAAAVAPPTEGAGAPVVAAQEHAAPTEAAAPAPEPAPAEPPTAATEPLTLDSYSEMKLPDEFKLSEPIFAKFKEAALANNITPEAASSLLEVYQEAARHQTETAQTAFRDLQNAWIADYRSWPEFATEEATATSVAKIGRFVDEFGTPAVRDILDQTGAGNNPDIVRMFLKISDALDEGRPAQTGNPRGPSNAGKSLGERMYPAKAATA